MAVYSKIMGDAAIINLVSGKYSNILLIGCGGCINESLAFTNHHPIFNAPEGKTLKDESIPIAVRLELNRIKNLLETNGHAVRIFESHELKKYKTIDGFLCIRKSGMPFDLLGLFSDFSIDVILTICCGAGTFGILNDYGKSIPVLQITRAFGMLSYSFVDEEDARRIDYKNSKIIEYL